MEEKCMVNDVLEAEKTKIIAYQEAIMEAENIVLRQTMEQIRNNEESFQYDLLKIAEVKGYYKGSENASQTEINKIKEEVDK